MDAIVRNVVAVQSEPRLLDQTYQKKFWQYGVTISAKIIEHPKERVYEVVPTIVEHKKTLQHLVLSVEKVHAKVVAADTNAVTDAAVARKLVGKRDPSEADYMAARDAVMADVAVAWVKERLTLGTVGGGDSGAGGGNEPVKLCAALSADSDVLYDRPVLLKELKENGPSVSRSVTDWSATLRRLDPNWAQENMPTTLRTSFTVNEALDRKTIVKQLWWKIIRRLTYARQVYKTQLMLERRAALLSHLMDDDSDDSDDSDGDYSDDGAAGGGGGGGSGSLSRRGSTRSPYSPPNPQGNKRYSLMFDPNDEEMSKLRQMHKQGRRTSTSNPGAAVVLAPVVLRSKSVVSTGKGSAAPTAPTVAAGNEAAAAAAAARPRHRSVADLFRARDEERAAEALAREAAEYAPFIAGSVQELGGMYEYMTTAATDVKDDKKAPLFGPFFAGSGGNSKRVLPAVSTPTKRADATHGPLKPLSRVPSRAPSPQRSRASSPRQDRDRSPAPSRLVSSMSEKGPSRPQTGIQRAPEFSSVQDLPSLMTAGNAAGPAATSKPSQASSRSARSGAATPTGNRSRAASPRSRADSGESSRTRQEGSRSPAPQQRMSLPHINTSRGSSPAQSPCGTPSILGRKGLLSAERKGDTKVDAVQAALDGDDDEEDDVARRPVPPSRTASSSAAHDVAAAIDIDDDADADAVNVGAIEALRSGLLRAGIGCEATS